MAEENKKMIYTQEGYKRLQDELAELTTTKRAEIAGRLEEARAQGDLSENAEYSDALDEQARNEARILEITNLLKNSEIIKDEDISTTNVSLGSKVTIRDEETKTEEIYEIVASNDSDIFSNRISVESPIGKAIIGKKKGASVTVTTPAGQFKYKIIKLEK